MIEGPKKKRASSPTGSNQGESPSNIIQSAKKTKKKQKNRKKKSAFGEPVERKELSTDMTSSGDQTEEK